MFSFSLRGRHIVRSTLLLILSIVMGLSLVLFSQATALASSGPATATHNKPQATRKLPLAPLTLSATCFRNGCNGLDPYQSGCARSFYPAASAETPDGSMLVELEYSTICQTNWTQGYWLDRVARPLGVNIIRQAGSDGPYWFQSYWSSGGLWWINSNQVYAPYNKAEACTYAAQVGTGAYPGVCTNPT